MFVGNSLTFLQLRAQLLSVLGSHLVVVSPTDHHIFTKDQLKDMIVD